jgi:diguanylate cyclase (GGDEF)-like protein
MLRAADGTLLHINPAGERFVERLGLDVSYVRSSPSSMLDHIEVIDEDGRPYDAANLPVVSALRDTSSRDGTLGYALPGGGFAWYAIRAVPVLLADGTTGSVVTCDDVTERHDARQALEQELRAAAVEDPLTGLGNRRALAERLADAQLRRARAGGDIGLLYIDLDVFKLVNDTYGHAVGDRVLIETGRRLRAATREVDTVCRLGGDEFVVLCAPIDGSDGIRDLVDRLASMPPLTVHAGGAEIAVAESVGSIMVEPDEDLDHVLRRADAAMYRAKRSRDLAQ